MSGVAGLVLAAGAGRRMGVAKGLLHDPGGTAWVLRAARTLAEGGCDPVVVVVGARAGEVTALLPAGVRAVPAPDWGEGMGASLRAGLRAVAESAADAVLVSLVDTPGVSAAVVARLAELVSPAVLARAAYGGDVGHPVLLGREHWAGAAALASGDVGARGYLAGRPVEVVECGDVGSGADLDTPADLSAAYGGAMGSAVDRVARATPRTAPTSEPPGQDSSRVREPARRVALAMVTSEPLDVAEHEAAVADAAAGAVVSFSGVVRDHDGGRAVESIEYVGHPTASAVLTELVAQIAARLPVEAVAVSHRVGPLAVGEVALVVAVSAAHRQEAFGAAGLLVDEIKGRLPVWKRQQFPDGTDEWVACP